MKEIDIKTWNRRLPYEQFIKYTHPQFSIGTRLDVTEIVKYCKKYDKSFFTTFLFIMSKCMNRVEELRIRIKNGKIVMYDVINPSYIVMMKEGVIATCETLYNPDFDTFYNNCRADIEKVKQGVERESFNSTDDNDVIYTSCLPWIDVQQLTNPYNIDDPEQSSIPRVAWGRFVEENGKYMMGFNMECHHALLDGEPVSRCINYMIEEIKNFDKEYGEDK